VALSPIPSAIVSYAPKIIGAAPGAAAEAQMCLGLGVCASLIEVLSSPSPCSISDLTAFRKRATSRRSLEVGAIGW
jgi:hypothetical protein